MARKREITLAERERYREIGRKGGLAARATAERRGDATEFYMELGRRGGLALKKAKGASHFAEIGTKGGAKTKELCRRARELEGKK